MVQSLLVIIWMVKNKEKVDTNGQMVVSMMENGMTIKLMDMYYILYLSLREFTNGLMGEVIAGIG